MDELDAAPLQDTINSKIEHILIQDISFLPVSLRQRTPRELVDVLRHRGHIDLADPSAVNMAGERSKALRTKLKIGALAALQSVAIGNPSIEMESSSVSGANGGGNSEKSTSLQRQGDEHKWRADVDETVLRIRHLAKASSNRRRSMADVTLTSAAEQFSHSGWMNTLREIGSNTSELGSSTLEMVMIGDFGKVCGPGRGRRGAT